MQIDHRDLTYASIARSRSGRILIKTIENLTGRPRLLWRLRSVPERVAAGEPLWPSLLDAYELTLRRHGPALAKDGSSLVICNHPYGLIDGLALCALLAETGRPFRVVANDVFAKVPALQPHILPISFAQGRDTARANLATRRAASTALRDGEIVALFPAGATASPPRPFAAPHEGTWSSFAARLVIESGASVQPVFMPPTRRWAFDNLGFIAANLRHALQINGVSRRIGTTIDVHVGEPFDPRDGPSMTIGELTERLRRSVLELSRDPIDPAITGRRF